MKPEMEEARLGGPGLADNLACVNSPPPDSELSATNQALAALNQLTWDLGDMAGWLERLRVEIRRSELLFDLGLLTESQLDGLKRRVALWRAAAKAALAEQMPGRLVGADELGGDHADHEVFAANLGDVR
jgi:hypothetical protein